MPSEYAYLGGGLTFAAVWAVLFLTRKDLRREMLWASLVGLPFGFIERFFVPYYWDPASLFNLMRQYGFGIEGFLYSFSVAGIAAVGYELLEKRTVVKIKRDKGLHLSAFIIFIVVYLTLESLFPTDPMLDLIAAFVCGAVTTVALRPDLLKKVIVSGLAFGVFYFAVFAVVNAMFGNLVNQFYSPQILGNAKLLGVPWEEMLGAFSGGAFWSTLYEYTRAYRDMSVAKYRA